MKALAQQFIRFGVVGLIAFGIDYGLLILLTEMTGLNYLVSATISFTVSVIFNYIASMRFVFKRREGVSRVREFIIFLILSIVGLGLNDLLMWAGVSLAIDYRVVKLGATLIVMVYNFITRKLFLEERPSKQ
jgi:putative flippase GtrA